MAALWSPTLPHWPGLEGQGHADRLLLLLLRFILLAKCNQRLLVAATVQAACVTAPGKLGLVSPIMHSLIPERLVAMTILNDIQRLPQANLSPIEPESGNEKRCSGTQDEGTACCSQLQLHALQPMRAQASAHVTVWPPKRQLPSCIDC